MPLSKIQTDILRLLAAHRDPESYVAGAAALNRNAPRYSGDIDVFHSREERVASAAQSDAETLAAAGYGVSWTRRLPAIYTAEVSGQAGATHLEWVVDSDFRFFPVMRDDTFGYVLHPFDLATNKVMAAAGRREVRDIVDLVTVHETILPLGAVIWAGVEKLPGYTPEGLIFEIRRNSHYRVAEWRAIASTEPIDPNIVTSKLRAGLDGAEAFCRSHAYGQTRLALCSVVKWCSPILTGWAVIKRMPGGYATTGLPAPTSQPLCWSVTRRTPTAKSKSRNVPNRVPCSPQTVLPKATQGHIQMKLDPIAYNPNFS